MKYSAFIILFAFLTGRAYEAGNWWGFGIALAVTYGVYIYQSWQFEKLISKPISDLRELVKSWQ